MGSILAYFTYYGGSTGKDKKVTLSMESDDTHTVSIEGYPDLTKKDLSFEKGQEILDALKDMSLKDWGSSEIQFTEDFHSHFE